MPKIFSEKIFSKKIAPKILLKKYFHQNKKKTHQKYFPKKYLCQIFFQKKGEGSEMIKN